MQGPRPCCVAADSRMQSAGDAFGRYGEQESLAHNTELHPEASRTQEVTKKSVLCLGESRTRLDQTGAEREAHLYVSSELDQLLLRHPHRHVSHLLQGLGLPLSAHQDFHCRTDRSSGRHRSSPSPLLVSSRCPTAPTDSPVPAAEQPQLPLPQPLAPPDADGT